MCSYNDHEQYSIVSMHTWRAVNILMTFVINDIKLQSILSFNYKVSNMVSKVVHTRLQLPPSDIITVYCDEVGRGSLIHDVVAAAVIMPSEYDADDQIVGKIKDSKKCSHKLLQELSAYIKDTAIAWGIGSATAAEIDTHNILNATMMAMHRALDDVHKQVAFDTIAVDGNRFKTYMTPDGCNFVTHQCIIGGDASHLGVAAASILAKVHRDTVIAQLAKENKDYTTLYKWDTNMGYGTQDHIAALMKYGPTVHHRFSFRPVDEAAKRHNFHEKA